MVSRKRRSYTTVQREAVLADVPTIGVSAAARKHDVPQTCVSQGAKAARVTRVVAKVADPAVAPPSSASEPVRRDDSVSEAVTRAPLPNARSDHASRRSTPPRRGRWCWRTWPRTV